MVEVFSGKYDRSQFRKWNCRTKKPAAVLRWLAKQTFWESIAIFLFVTLSLSKISHKNIKYVMQIQTLLIKLTNPFPKIFPYISNQFALTRLLWLYFSCTETKKLNWVTHSQKYSPANPINMLQLTCCGYIFHTHYTVHIGTVWFI